jgi:hypothetical protein
LSRAIAEGDSNKTTAHAKHEMLGQELTHQPASCGAKRQPNAHLARACPTSRERERSKIDARNNQQRDPLPPNSRYNDVSTLGPTGPVSASTTDAVVAVRFGILGSQPFRDDLHLRLCLVASDTRLQPGHGQSQRSRSAGWKRVEREWAPDLWIEELDARVRRQDADYGVTLSIETD